MMLSRRPVHRVLSLLIALAVFSSLTFAAPAKRAAKSKKSSASARSAGKQKGQARNSSARGRGGRAERVSRRNDRGRGRYATSTRGRSRHGRYRGEYAAAPAASHSAGVHNYLAEEWSKAQAPGARNAALVPPSNATFGGNANATFGANANATFNNTNPNTAAVQSATLNAPLSPTMVATGATGVRPAASPGALSAEMAKPKATDPAQPEPLLMNPLVEAYSESLAVRGHRADNQGFIVTTMKGEVLAEHNADTLFNPASVTKVATSLTAISRLGADFKFRTALFTDGALDPETGVLHGSLYIVGSGDPAFFYENAMMIADKLNAAGIREIAGDFYVLGHFYFNFSTSLEASAKALRNALSSSSWNGAAKSAYPRFQAMRQSEGSAGSQSPSGPPSLIIKGQTITSPTVNTGTLKQLAVHTSLPLVAVLKGLNDFSNNWMATVIGNLVGGPDAVERFLKTEVGFKDDECNFATASGLGANSISPRNTITILRKLIAYLNGKGLTLDSILPVAGVDRGTLQRRFTDAFRASVVAKTGTLNGVSALAGVAYTQQRGPLLFVIYNRGGSPHSFRAAQDETLKKIITMYGGPAPVRYYPNAGSR